MMYHSVIGFDIQVVHCQAVKGVCTRISVSSCRGTRQCCIRS